MAIIHKAERSGGGKAYAVQPGIMIAQLPLGAINGKKLKWPIIGAVQKNEVIIVRDVKIKGKAFAVIHVADLTAGNINFGQQGHTVLLD